MRKSALTVALEEQIHQPRAAREEIDAALAEAPDDRIAPPVLLPAPDRSPGANEPATGAPEDTHDDASAHSDSPQSSVPAQPEAAAPTVAAVKRSRGRGRANAAETREVLDSMHLRFPRGMTSWSATLRMPAELISAVDEWKMHYFRVNAKEALNTRILSVALQRITPEELEAAADQLRSVDPAVNLPWSARIPADMRPLLFELSRSTSTPLDKSQVGVAALTKFLREFADPRITPA